VSDPTGVGRSDGSDQGKSQIKDLPGLAGFAALGSTIACCLALGVVLGIYADNHWVAAPWGLLIGIVLGAVAAVASVVKLVRRYL
jgi:F0F1-type ATP synthase assembly protein I